MGDFIRRLRDGPIERTGTFNSANIEGFLKDAKIPKEIQSHIVSRIASHAKRMGDYSEDKRITLYINYQNDTYEKRVTHDILSDYNY